MELINRLQHGKTVVRLWALVHGEAHLLSLQRRLPAYGVDMLISPNDAFELLQQAVPTGPDERIPLADATGRVLRETVRTPRPLPPYDRVMMDGIAIDEKAWKEGRREFAVLGKVHAGEEAPPLDAIEGCFWVMTGAPCPAGASRVIPREYILDKGPRVRVESDYSLEMSKYIHTRGSDSSEDADLLDSGAVLSSAEIGIAASCGYDQLLVAKRPRVAIVTTGDELIEPGQPIADHQVYRSNGYALAALLKQNGDPIVELWHCPDEPKELQAKLGERLAEVDFLVTIGGVSKGDRDFLPGVLSALGVKNLFHGVAQRPGKPLWAGRAQSGAIVLGLPGNPVSALIGARRYLVLAIERFLGQESTPAIARLAAPFSFAPSLACFLPVQMGENGAEPLPGRNSGDFLSLKGTTGFLELPAEKTDFAVGEHFPFFPW